MPITNVQDIGTYTSGGLTAPASQAITVPAGGVAAGNSVLIGGYTRNGTSVTSVTDSMGNVYVVRAGGGNTAPFLADGYITTPLVAGNSITVTRTGVAELRMDMVEFSGLMQNGYQGLASATFSTTTATGGALTTQSDGSLVLGLFAQNLTGAEPISVQGPGYSNLVGIGGASGAGQGFDWEYKVAAQAGTETATATLRGSPNGTFTGYTVAYSPVVVTRFCTIV